MKWEMEIEELEAVLEKIWDLHDKLSDAIHSISRAHFLHSLRRNGDHLFYAGHVAAAAEEEGFVYVKDFRQAEAEEDSEIREAKSLNAIRTALENLEDHIQFFHTVHVQQRTEREAAIAQLEQSRIVLALRLSEHNGKKYKVIEEALVFVGDVCDANAFVSPESPPVTPGDNSANPEGKRSNIIMRVFDSSVNIAKKTLKLDDVGGLLGNAVLVAVSMITLVHMQKVAVKEHRKLVEDEIYVNGSARKSSRTDGASSSSRLSNLDVLLARG